MKNALQTTLIDIAGELECRHLQYALVGGLAASIRGRMRVTDDIDLVVLCDVDQALELIQSLKATDFTPLFLDVEKVVRSAFLVPLLHQRTGIHLDLSVGVSGFERQIVSRATKERVTEKELNALPRIESRERCQTAAWDGSPTI